MNTIEPSQNLETSPSKHQFSEKNGPSATMGHAPEHQSVRKLILKKDAPRLLYRGSLSLPDSHILLDGLTFTINLPSDDPQASMKLLESPLPLALESMRGRVSLSFIGVQEMEKLYCDFSGGVTLHVHSRSILTRQLFADTLCAKPIAGGTGHTELGIRIRLGESESSGLSSSSASNDIIVYGRPHPSSSVMQLCVALILPPLSPVPLPKAVTRLRPPRPDDPIPRLPPAGFGLTSRGVKRSLDNGKGKEKVDGSDIRKRPKKSQENDTAHKKSSKTGIISAADIQELGKNSRIGKEDTDIFKIPPPPPLHKTKSYSTSQNLDEDVFYMPINGNIDRNSDVETRNRTLIKKCTVRQLAAVEITKHHDEFKEMFNLTYRSICFALRNKLQAVPLDKEKALIDSLVDMHIKLYLSGIDELQIRVPDQPG